MALCQAGLVESYFELEASRLQAEEGKDGPKPYKSFVNLTCSSMPASTEECQVAKLELFSIPDMYKLTVRE